MPYTVRCNDVLVVAGQDAFENKPVDRQDLEAYHLARRRPARQGNGVVFTVAVLALIVEQLFVFPAIRLIKQPNWHDTIAAINALVLLYIVVICLLSAASLGLNMYRAHCIKRSLKRSGIQFIPKELWDSWVAACLEMEIANWHWDSLAAEIDLITGYAVIRQFMDARESSITPDQVQRFKVALRQKALKAAQGVANGLTATEREICRISFRSSEREFWALLKAYWGVTDQPSTPPNHSEVVSDSP